MELTLLEQSKDNLNLFVKGMEPAYANALRRAIMDLVPTMAIETVNINQNSSILYDEVLAHRLGLIPLKTDLESYVLPDQCKCKGQGCAQCQVDFKIQVTGPGPVYASELKFEDPKIKPVFDKMLIANLEKGQEIQVYGKAQLGIGRDHMKFAPGLVYYKYKPKLTIEEQPENPEEVAKSCPKEIFEVKKGQLEINKDKVFECHLCQACVEESEGKIKLEEKDDEYLFYIESFGQLSGNEMVKKAISILVAETDEFSKQLKEI
mgnify:CR=1 FL=1